MNLMNVRIVCSLVFLLCCYYYHCYFLCSYFTICFLLLIKSKLLIRLTVSSIAESLECIYKECIYFLDLQILFLFCDFN